MSLITIKDLRKDLALDRKAMSSIRGAGGAPWVFAFKPHQEAFSSFGVGPAVNLYQVTNNIFAEQIVNKSVNINNSGDNSTINAVLISSLASA
jgi:hypothetical protein